MKLWLTLLLALTVIQTEIRLAQSVRYYVCDKNCPIDKCEEEPETEDSKVCVKIIETDPDGEMVELPNMCVFDCANKCYENQLTAIPGPCPIEEKSNQAGRRANKPPAPPSSSKDRAIADDEDEDVIEDDA
jgi:hypothetical protein